MTGGANFYPDFRNGCSRGESISTGTGNLAIGIPFRVNFFFISLLYQLGWDEASPKDRH